MVSNKSDILKILSNNYPNFLKKDLSKFIDIVLNDIQDALRRGERVELRDNFTLERKIQKIVCRKNRIISTFIIYQRPCNYYR